jgi:hypothetical protein
VSLASALRGVGRLLVALGRLLGRERRVVCAFCGAEGPPGGSAYAAALYARQLGFARYALDTWSCARCRPYLAGPGAGGAPC